MNTSRRDAFAWPAEEAGSQLVLTLTSIAAVTALLCVQEKSYVTGPAFLCACETKECD